MRPALDVSAEHDGRLKRAYDTGFGRLARKERIYEAVEVFGKNRSCTRSDEPKPAPRRRPLSAPRSE